MTDLIVAGADGTEKKLAIHSTAATSSVYQRIFKREFNADVDSITSNGGNAAVVQDVLPKVFYVWNLLSEYGKSLSMPEILGKTENDYIEWLMEYAVLSFVSETAVEIFAEEYSKGTKTNSTAKN